MAYHTKHYNTLGVSPKATVAEIKKAYKTLAMKYHPDKNPTAGDKFKEISHAYGILVDPETRFKYDCFGENVPRTEGSSTTENQERTFTFTINKRRAACNSNGSEGRAKKRTRPEYQTFSVQYPLEHFYTGKKTNVILNGVVVECKQCLGVGWIEHTLGKCTLCLGSGTKETTIRFRTVVVKTQDMCEPCQGAGEIFVKEPCRQCIGTGATKENVPHEIVIDQGTMDGVTLTLDGGCYLSLKQKPHPVFKRRGDDLYCKVRITLAESLCGISRILLTHLDGHGLHIDHPVGSIIRPGQVKRIVGEGMPKHLNPTDKGDLFIVFEVEFPKDNWLSPQVLKVLKKCLPSNSPSDTKPDVIDICTLEDTDGGEDAKGTEGGRETGSNHVSDSDVEKLHVQEPIV
ncbi:MAG: hypothetical protein J3Q66DRAFT_311076 [Benniella sp.]|nr:MAG: hypothetical protein J3Q66DRAFT_311076 [Benniella sp.]